MPQTIAQKKSRVVSKTAKLQSYSSLKSSIKKTIALGKKRATAAVERQKVRTVWEVGQLILKHVFLNKDRGGYGAQVIPKLSKDMKMSQTVLKYMVEFARTYPIRPARGELTWTHYKALLAVNNSEKRMALEKKAAEKNWSSNRLRSEIKKVKGSYKNQTLLLNSEKSELLQEPARSKPDVYRMLTWRGKRVYDLGFSNYVEIKRKKKKTKEPNKKEALYFYKGVVDRVVDGDTVWVDVYLGFGFWSYQKLRLRALNAPEVISQAGQRAKRYLQRKLPNGTEIILRTTKPDKFDRYLADIWAGEKYINGFLIRAGHARVV